jgi:glutamate synthase (NADPH/NADH) large chain
LSGGRLVVRPDENAPFVAEEQVIAGNVIGYGATSGEIFVRGVVGERFCVRNSGATAVVEGVGDHACEYMTGGRAVILGPTGRNVAAGMSGGIAYVLDLDSARVNHEMVDVQPLTAADQDWLHGIIEKHTEETKSAVGAALLADWSNRVGDFVRIMPRDYQRVLEATRQAATTGRSVDEAVMEAARG